MTEEEILRNIEGGRTDYVFDLLALPNWKECLNKGTIKPLQWFVYYDDTTAIKAVLANGGNLDSIDLNWELSHAAFFGHWKVCDFLLHHGADVTWCHPTTGETPLHGALAKAGRPHFLYTIRLLLENGADVNAATVPNVETEAFMRDVRTKGETPLHRAAAYADEDIIRILLKHGADKTVRDAHGDSPLSWASQHLRPARILSLLTFDPHRIGEKHKTRMISDHGAGWGNGMEWNLMGDYLPSSDRSSS